MTKIIELRNVTKIFSSGFIFNRQRTIAADNITLSVDEENPSITALAGESGSGKTTLFLLMMGQIKPTQGEVYYRGKNIEKLSKEENKQLKRELQPIYQDPFAAYNPFYKVDHVLTTPLKRFNLSNSPAMTSDMIHKALELVGLRPAETLGRTPIQLSGGQRQRLMIARAILCQPKMILADEPVSMVDASLRATILASLVTLNRNLGIPIIYITHDITTAYQICDNIVILYAGSVAETGSTETIIRDPKHPYTQLLISAIPLPDRKQPWLSTQIEEKATTNVVQSNGCKFANRCPKCMPRCLVERPPLYQTDSHQAVACFLYSHQPKVVSDDISDMFIKHRSSNS